MIVKRVRHNGEIRWKGRLLYISQVLAQQPIGLKPIDEQTGRSDTDFIYLVFSMND